MYILHRSFHGFDFMGKTKGITAKMMCNVTLSSHSWSIFCSQHQWSPSLPDINGRYHTATPKQFFSFDFTYSKGSTKEVFCCALIFLPALVTSDLNKCTWSFQKLANNLRYMYYCFKVIPKYCFICSTF
jgi:hypothetical protein